MLRPAKIEDAELIVSIRQRAILAQPETFWTRQQLERAANHYGVDYIVANFSEHECYLYNDKAFVAWKDTYLASLFLLPSEQNKGIGRELLLHAESAINKKHDQVWLFAHPYAKKFYERNGYTKQPETESPFGVPLNKFSKRL